MCAPLRDLWGFAIMQYLFFEILCYEQPEIDLYCGPKNVCLKISCTFSGGLLVGILSWAGIRNWRHLMLVLSTPAALLSLLYFILPESPRWLLAKGTVPNISLRQTLLTRSVFSRNSVFQQKMIHSQNKLYICIIHIL